MKVNRLSPFTILAMLCFIIVIIAYFIIFSYQMPFDYEPIEGYLYPTNTHDNYVYVNEANNISQGAGDIGFNNNFGIAFIYSVLSRALFYIGFDVSYDILSLVINCFLVLYCFQLFKKIISLISLPYIYVFSFFAFSSFIYFAQLINKDIFTIALIFKGVQLALSGNKKKFILVGVLSVLIRIQLPVFFAVFYFLCFYKTNRHFFVLFSVYTFFAFVNGIFAKFQGVFISEETLSDGLSYWVYYLNYNYYVGSFILNPLRVVQYFYGYMLSFDFIQGDKLDVSRAKDLPQLLLFIYCLPAFFSSYLSYGKSMNDIKSRVLLSCVTSFFLVWLLNPSVSPRYFINFLPVVTLISFYYRYNHEKK